MKTFIIAAALLSCAGLAGCSNTAQGLKQDTKQNAPKVAQEFRKAGNAAASATQKAANNLTKGNGKPPNANPQPNNPAKS